MYAFEEISSCTDNVYHLVALCVFLVSENVCFCIHFTSPKCYFCVLIVYFPCPPRPPLVVTVSLSWVIVSPSNTHAYLVFQLWPLHVLQHLPCPFSACLSLYLLRDSLTSLSYPCCVPIVTLLRHYYCSHCIPLTFLLSQRYVPVIFFHHSFFFLSCLSYTYSTKSHSRSRCLTVTFSSVLSPSNVLDRFSSPLGLSGSHLSYIHHTISVTSLLYPCLSQSHPFRVRVTSPLHQVASVSQSYRIPVAPRHNLIAPLSLPCNICVPSLSHLCRSPVGPHLLDPHTMEAGGRKIYIWWPSVSSASQGLRIFLWYIFFYDCQRFWPDI